MKNFRKTIIALATVAAMLVPSVAMAATLTTTVDKDIKGDVYVGFYDGAVLKDVVKTTVDDITVSEAETAGTEELAAKVTVENVKVADRASDGAEIYKLVFKFNDATSADMITSTGIMLSFDNTVVQPVLRQGKYGDLTYEQITSNETYMTAPILGGSYLDIFDEPQAFTTKAMWTKDGNRTAVAIDTVDTSNTGFSASENNMFTEFYYRVLAGEVTADTFALEVTGDFVDIIGDKGKTKAIAIGTNYWYGFVREGELQADTLTFGGFPWKAATTKDLTVTVPEGAEDYTPTMFIWDADQIAQCAPITTFTKN